MDSTLESPSTGHSDSVLRYLEEVVSSGIYSGMRVSCPDGGKFLKLFEAEARRRFRVEHAVAMNSATSALHAALFAVGIGADDIVLVSGVTMTASASAVVHAGAKPVFADVNPRTGVTGPREWNEAFELCQLLYDQPPKAMVAVHLLGQQSVWQEGDLIVIEDAAQAPGCTTSTGKLLGTLGAIGVFSLNQDKVIQCGEGGFAVTQERIYADRMRLLRNHGENQEDMIGHNYRLTELEAAVAYDEIQHLEERQHAIMDASAYLAEMISEGSERFVPADVENPPYYFHVMDQGSGTEETIGSWRRGYARPLCCIPGFKHRHGHGCLVGAHEFHARVLLVKAPRNRKSAEALAGELLKN